MTQQKPVASRTALALTGPAPERGRYLRITMYIRKLPGITDDYFHAYWANNHRQAALANSTFAAKIRRYSQYHITPELREQAARLGGTVLDFDGAAEFWVESLEDWEAIWGDPEFVRILSADMANFVLEPLHVTLGYDYLVVGNDWEAAPAA
ncbi:Putative EthD domain-containing protein [Colletotrichum destructivum]|uniref:EthD domain-containing protein n=1 Tax=Colletotrichum destructivum TaxID=34406 RepID=A0AAX4I7E3_9PEZI|nr:Putative EthD domain-containing protein [Colletotrichum destructivum]